MPESTTAHAISRAIYRDKVRAASPLTASTERAIADDAVRFRLI